MGPLVPEVIGHELNLIVAILVGMAFGFVLEQAGFSSSKKLVGLFYGYDFTVLRVFFTGGVTAMLGVIALNHFGLLDMGLVYINPTFIQAALLGGVIMGLGFVVGGFCPGTSICAAAIGKIDAMVFVVGSFLGALLFAEGYPLWEELYKAGGWGQVQIFTVLGMSQALFAFLLVLMAVGAFWFVSWVEKRVNGTSGEAFRHPGRYLGFSILAVSLGLSAFFLPDRKADLLQQANNPELLKTSAVIAMSNDELAFRIMDQDRRLQIFQVGPAQPTDSLLLPQAMPVSLENLFDKEVENKLSLYGRINVFVSQDELLSQKAAWLGEKLGYENLYVLQGGLGGFRQDILQPVVIAQNTSPHQADTYRFRKEAAKVIPKMIQEYRQKANGQTVKKEKKRVLGGC